MMDPNGLASLRQHGLRSPDPQRCQLARAWLWRREVQQAQVVPVLLPGGREGLQRRGGGGLVGGGELDRSLMWRDVLCRYGIGDVASAVFADQFGC